MSDKNLIERYTPANAPTTGSSAITFILLALSGLALFHPAFFFLTNLFGGGTWTRILHPFIGVVLAVSFVVPGATLLARQSHHPRRPRVDARSFSDVLANRDAEPARDRQVQHRAEDTILDHGGDASRCCWSTGIVIWQPWFAPLFPIGLAARGRAASMRSRHSC